MTSVHGIAATCSLFSAILTHQTSIYPSQTNIELEKKQAGSICSKTDIEAMKKGSLGCVLLFVLLIFAHEEMKMVVARRPPIKYCESRSHGFRGVCFSKTNCGLACRHEGFQGGYCKPLSRHCYCRKPCV